MTDERGSPTLPLAAVAALRAGNKIEAIKLVREERNLGLKEAKDLVEDYIRTQPALQQQLQAAQAQVKARLIRWVLMIVGLLAVAFYLYRMRM